MARKNVYVTKRENGWAVVIEGNQRADSIYQTQREAIQRAKSLAMLFEAELRIQGRDELFINSYSYGNDPFPPRDNKH